jgi:glycosyltransferase involved in cell wall biosynthesis
VTSAHNIVVTNGVEIEALDPERGSQVRNRYGIARDAIVVPQICWMVEVKGVDVLLRAAQAIRIKHPFVRFLLVGGGAQLAEYRALSQSIGLENAVCFTDLISDPVGAGVLDASDIYCQPSRWQEACPLAVLENMSKKLLVVASDTGGLPELVANGQTGILFPVGYDQSLAAALDRLVQDRELRHDMGEAGYASVLQSHQIEYTVFVPQKRAS